MDFGLAIFPTDYAAPPAQLARAAEERGFESLSFPEHTHIPASRETPYPGGGDLPPEYLHTHDPLVALASAAAVTKRVRRSKALPSPSRRTSARSRTSRVQRLWADPPATCR